MTTKQKELRDRIAEAWRESPSFARVLAETYLENYPSDGLIWAYYGDSLRALGAFSDARTALHTARGLVERVETKAFVVDLIGDVDKAVGDYAAAERCFREALELEPEKGYRHLYLGVALRRLGRDPEAEACYRTALTLEGDHDEFLLNLGYVLQARGALEEAADCFSRALVIDPEYREARHSLKDVQQAIAFLRERSLKKGAVEQGVAPDGRAAKRT